MIENDEKIQGLRDRILLPLNQFIISFSSMCNQTSNNVFGTPCSFIENHIDLVENLFLFLEESDDKLNALSCNFV